MKKVCSIRDILIRLSIFITLFICLLWQTSAADTLYEAGKRSWLQGDFHSAYDHLITYRKQPYGRRAEVDYMLGTSGCRLIGLCEWGGNVLDWILYAYPLTAGSRDLVTHERDICRGATTPLVIASAPPLEIGELISAGMRAKGKTFYWLDREVPVNSYPARRIRQVDPREFESRIIPQGSANVATRQVESLVPDFRVETYKQFVIASGSGHSEQQLKDISNTLDSFFTFLVRSYRFRAFSHYITFYLVPSIEDLRKVARRIHGLDVSPATIGYAFREDLSVVGVIPGIEIGTLLHELFHLTVRQDFGDIPQWLDEGMASLYEVSKVYGQDFLGEPNWRGKVLDQLWTLRPTLDELVLSPWFAFDLPKEYDDATADKLSVQKQAAHMAMARYFVLYLQEQKKLQDVFFSYRDAPIEKVRKDARDHAVKVIKKTLGRPLVSVQEDFEEWFKQVQKLGIPR